MNILDINEFLPKILLVNKFYYPRGGDCVCVLGLENLLKQKGHEVAIFSMQHSQNLPSVYSNYFPSEVEFSLENKKQLVETVIRPLGFSREVKKKFTALLDDFQPDVVHLNNIHSQLSPIIAQIAHKRGIKVVWTLHDYKLICSRSDCLRNDTHCCDLCQISLWNIIKNKCVKNSLPASFLGYLEASKWNKKKLESMVDTFICPSIFMQKKMEDSGIESTKLFQVHNFIDTGKTKRIDFRKEDYYCYIGRLSVEKGVKTLIKAAKQLPYKLKVVGAGPMLEELKMEAVGSGIEFLGYRPWEEIKEIVGKARFSVIPSEWYENNPLSVIESLCLGTPVLGADIGGITELLNQNNLNRLFLSGDIFDLKSKIEEMWNRNCLEIDYEKLAESSQIQFNADTHYDILMKIYQNEKVIE